MTPLGKRSHYLVLHEIGLQLGRLDYVIVEFDRRAKVLRHFLLLEVMAVSTTTTGQVIRCMLDTLQNRPRPARYNYGINLRQVVSRMMIQVIAKAHATAQWNIPVVWAIQDVLFQFMLSTTRLRLTPVDLNQDHISTSLPILFFIYTMQPSLPGGTYQLHLAEVWGGTLGEIEEVLIPKVIPTRKEITEVLLASIQAGKFFDLTDEPTAPPPPPSFNKLATANQMEYE
jgi:hypothetical protein